MCRSGEQRCGGAAGVAADRVAEVGQAVATEHRYEPDGLSSYPALHFQPIAALGGIASIAVHYRSVENRSAIEVMELDTRGQIHRAAAHYGAPRPAEAFCRHGKDRCVICVSEAMGHCHQTSDVFARSRLRSAELDSQ